MAIRRFALALTACISIAPVQAAENTSLERSAWLAAAEFVLENESAGTKDPTALKVFESTSFPTDPRALDQLQKAARAGFCGLSPEKSSDVISRLAIASDPAVSVAEVFRQEKRFALIGARPKKGDFLGLSRVVFLPDSETAWLGLDISKQSGSIIRLRRIAGAWADFEECATWVSW